LKHLHGVHEGSYLLLLNRLDLSLLPLIIWVLGHVPSMWNMYFNHRKIWVNSVTSELVSKYYIKYW
jgi:hypothetical protein